MSQKVVWRYTKFFENFKPFHNLVLKKLLALVNCFKVYLNENKNIYKVFVNCQGAKYMSLIFPAPSGTVLNKKDISWSGT